MKVQTVCCRLARCNWMLMKDRKKSKEKTKGLQKGNWNDKRFDRE